MAFILLSIIYTIFVVPFNERSEAVLNVVAISIGKINEIFLRLYRLVYTTATESALRIVIFTCIQQPVPSRLFTRTTEQS